MNYDLFVGIALIVSAVLGLIGTAFASDPLVSNAFYTLAGFGFYIFGVWAAFRLFGWV